MSLAIKDRWTLDDYLISLFEKNQTDSEEFQFLLRTYGRERIERTWKEYRQRPPQNPQLSQIPEVQTPKQRFSRFHPAED